MANLRIPPPDYEAEVQKQRALNVRHFMKSINQASTLKKLHNYATRFGHEPELVIYKAKTDPLFAEQFAKDPKKQSIHQRLAAQFLAQIPHVDCFETLPNDQLWLPVPTPSSKSVDFKWTSGPWTCLASHKHTEDEGGAQDNQFHDLKQFLRDAHQIKDPLTAIIAIADGPYYQRRQRWSELSALAAASPVPTLVSNVQCFQHDWTLFQQKLV